MLKFLFIFFIIVFGLYVLFSRNPDFFDGTTTTGCIRFLKDSTQSVQPYALFSVDGKDSFKTGASYLFRSFKENEKITVIYEKANPQKAAVYSWWGYWCSWKELLACIAGYIILFRVAKSITSNPSPEALKEQEEYGNKPKIKKRKYS